MLGLLVLLLIALGLLLALLTAVLAWQMVHPQRRTAAWAIARSLPGDPNDLNLQYEEWWLERPQGVCLPVWDINCRSSTASENQTGLTAVFVHGWGHGRVNSLQRIEPFLPLVDRIVLYDLRGHGDARGSASTLGHGEEEDLLALLDRLGHARYVIVGHSMGAVIALNAAVKDRPHGRVAGVIAYGPYCCFHRTLRGRMSVNALPARPLTDFALMIHRLRGVQPPGVQLESLEGHPTALLIVHGMNDRISPLADSRAIATAVRKARLIEVADAAHTDAHWIDREGHDEAVRWFFAQVHEGEKSHLTEMTHEQP